MNREEWWAKLESTGWLAELPAEEARQLRKQLDADTADPRLFFLKLASGSYDAECINEEGDYRKVVRAYWTGARGALPPMKVKDRIDWTEQKAEISVTVQGRTYSREFVQENDYVADGFHDFINGIMEGIRESRRFHELPTVDQIAQFAFVTPAVFQRAYKVGVIPEQKSLGIFLGLGSRPRPMAWT